MAVTLRCSHRVADPAFILWATFARYSDRRQTMLYLVTTI